MENWLDGWVPMTGIGYQWHPSEVNIKASTVLCLLMTWTTHEFTLSNLQTIAGLTSKGTSAGWKNRLYASSKVEHSQILHPAPGTEYACPTGQPGGQLKGCSFAGKGLTTI